MAKSASATKNTNQQKSRDGKLSLDLPPGKISDQLRALHGGLSAPQLAHHDKYQRRNREIVPVAPEPRPERTEPKKESGKLYVARLVPDLKPERLKLGFSDRLSDRLAEHRTAAPTLELLHSWPCLRSWERAAIACIAQGERQIGPEAFDFIDITIALKRGDRFFGLLPPVENTTAP